MHRNSNVSTRPEIQKLSAADLGEVSGGFFVCLVVAAARTLRLRAFCDEATKVEAPRAEPCLVEVKRVVTRVLTLVEHLNDIDKVTEGLKN
jgi:hypothetical protein